MSYDFERDSDQYLVNTNTPVTGMPFTISSWFNAESHNDYNIIFGLWNSLGSYDGGYTVSWTGTGAHRAIYDKSHGQTGTNYGTMVIGEWHQSGGIFRTNADRQTYFDGIGGNVNVVVEALITMDSIAVGCHYQDGVQDHYADGLIAECALWNVALSDGEMLALGKRYSPLFIRPQNLVFYAPLIRDLRDIVGGYDLAAVNGPVVAEHPPIIYPASPFISFPSAAAGGLSIPVAMNYYRRIRNTSGD